MITGDVTQTDLPNSVTSGLNDADRVLQGISGIAFVNMSESDIVRHRLVQLIIRAYDRQAQNGNEENRRTPAAVVTDARPEHVEDASTERT